MMHCLQKKDFITNCITANKDAEDLECFQVPFVC